MSPIIINPENPIAINTVTFILGSTGSGKTTLQKQIISQMLEQGATVLWVTPSFTNEEAYDFSKYPEFYVYGIDPWDYEMGISTFQKFVCERQQYYDIDKSVTEKHLHLAIDELNLVHEATHSNSNLWTGLHYALKIIRKLNCSYSACSIPKVDYHHLSAYQHYGAATLINVDSLRMH